MTKISIRFFDDREVRALWDEENAKWWFSVLDMVAVLTDQDDYEKTRNYWKYLKAKLKREGSQVVSATTQLKLLAPDGRKRLTDVLDHDGIIALGKEFPSKKANRFIQWFTYSEESVDGKSRTKAYALFESSFINSIEVGTAKASNRSMPTSSAAFTPSPARSGRRTSPRAASSSPHRNSSGPLSSRLTRCPRTPSTRSWPSTRR
jgi:hypothetical protein